MPERLDDRPMGSRLCGYGHPGHECDRPATWHAIWEDFHTSSSCDIHRKFLAITPVYGRMPVLHRYNEVCDLPGSFWFTPEDPGLESYCYFGDVPSVRTAEAVEAWLDR